MVVPMEIIDTKKEHKMMKKISMTVEGRVQGVGFRYTTKQLADDIGIKGTVRNNEDGSVQIEAMGEEKDINQFLQQIKNNPTPFSKVDEVIVEEKESLQNFISFRIIN